MLDRGSSGGFPNVLRFSDPAPEPFALVVDETIHHGDLISAGDPTSDLEMSHGVNGNGSPQKPGDQRVVAVLDERGPNGCDGHVLVALLQILDQDILHFRLHVDTLHWQHRP